VKGRSRQDERGGAGKRLTLFSRKAEFWSSMKSMSDKDKHETAGILLALFIIVFLLLEILLLIN
jgi:hypothetical protein